MSFRKITALLLCMVLLIGCAAACGSGEEKTAPAKTSGAETTAPADTKESSTETSAPAEVMPEEDLMVLATGVITGEFNIIFAESEGDKAIASLISPTLLAPDRNGDRLTTRGTGVTTQYNGVDYTYDGAADVTWETDASGDTLYTITLKDGLKFSDGSDVTADDLIFTYYVLCDPSYNGPFRTGSSSIEGLKAYHYDNSAADSVTVTAQDIYDALGNPTDEMKQAINSKVIRPILREEREWCEANWERYISRFMITSDVELFVKLYTSSIDPEYSIDGKNFDQVFDETVEMFGMNYKALARIYMRDVDYFDSRVNTVIEEFLYNSRLQAAGGDPVPSISGITRVDDRTVTVRAKGFSEDQLDTICNIPILSLIHCGAFISYSYEDNSFGVTRGDIGSVHAKSDSPLGTGKYYLERYEKGRVVLAPNEYCPGGAVTGEKLTFEMTENAAEAIIQGHADIAEVELTSDVISSILAANSNDMITGDVISALLYDRSEYLYFGINAGLVKVGTDANSAESRHLRRAFAILLSAAREDAARMMSGNSLRLTEYIFPEKFEYTPKDGDGYYRTAYSTLSDGTPLGEDVLQSAIEEMKLGGYTVDEGLIIPPEGGKVEFNALVPPYLAGDNAMTEVLQIVSDSLATVGITLNIITQEDLDGFIVELKSKSVDIWCAKRTVGSEPEFTKYYSSGGDKNYFGLADTALDQQMKDLKELIDRYAAEQEAAKQAAESASAETLPEAEPETTAPAGSEAADAASSGESAVETAEAPASETAGNVSSSKKKTTAATTTTETETETEPPKPVTPEDITDAYKTLFNAIMDECVEVPAYIPRDAVIYSSERVQAEDPVVDQYYGLLNVIDEFALIGGQE